MLYFVSDPESESERRLSGALSQSRSRNIAPVQASWRNPFLEILRARGPGVIHGEGACLISALSRYGYVERYPEPGTDDQAAEDWALGQESSNAGWPTTAEERCYRIAVADGGRRL